jgi:hypothetical protein
MDEQKVEYVLESLKEIEVGQGKFILDMSEAIECLKKPSLLTEATISAMMILIDRHVDVHMIDGSLHFGILIVT